MDLTAAVIETISSRSLVPPGSSILIALSGGPDSTALLHCLRALSYPVEAAHLNHQFRGEEAEADAQFTIDLCKQLDVNLTVESIDVPKYKRDQKISNQQAAREIRYQFLERVRTTRDLNYIATGHNRDDRIETVLFNILRGTGVDGLRGVPYRRGNIIRPLLDVERAVIIQYLDEHELKPRTDSSNFSAKYARNNIRSELLPYLERRFNSAVRDSILRLSEIAGDESDYLNQLALSWISGRSRLPVAALLAEPVAMQRRILREWIRASVVSELSDVSQAAIDGLRSKLSRHCAITLPGASFVIESDGEAVAIRRLAAKLEDIALESIPLLLNNEPLFVRYFVKLTALGDDIDEKSLHVRQWCYGDRITTTGGAKKVQDVFTDKKIPREFRRQYPLLADKDGLIAVGDISYAARSHGVHVSVTRK
jgi:tRNA(Ile)-lysidine synthase